MTVARHAPRQWKWLGGTALILALASLPLIAIGYPAPRGDDTAYKSPGAEWAAHGRLVVPGLSGFLATAEDGFAHYPPLYPLLYGIWFRLVGFRLETALALTYAIHLAQSLWVGTVSERLLASASSLGTRARCALAISATVATYLNCAYFDRPEELGLCWVWFGCWTWGFASEPLDRRAYLGWGAVTGLAALTAPYTGLLSAILVTVRAVCETVQAPATGRVRFAWGRLQRLVLAGGISILLVAAWACWIEWRVPGILRDQLLDGSLAYFSGTEPRSWLERFARFPTTLAYHPPQLAIALAGLVLVPWAWTRRELVHRPAIFLWTGATSSLAIVAFMRPDAYTYFGATLFLFNALFALGFSRFLTAPSPGLRRAGWIAVVVCVLISGRSLFAHAWYACRLLDAERPGLAAASMRAVVPAGDLVAVTPRHWHAFQGRNPWRDAFLASLRSDAEIARCRWLVLYPGVGIPPYLDKFELVAQSPVTAPDDYTYAYSVWRRKTAGKDPPSPSATAAAGDGDPQSHFVQRTSDGNRPSE